MAPPGNSNPQPLSTEEQHKLLRELERDAVKWDGYLFLFVTAFAGVEGFGCLFHAVSGVQGGGEINFHVVAFLAAFCVAMVSAVSTFQLKLYKWEANEAVGPSQPASILVVSKSTVRSYQRRQKRLVIASLLFCTAFHLVAFISEDAAVCSTVYCHVDSLLTWHKILVATWQPAQHALLTFAIPAMVREMEGPLRELQNACYSFEKL